MLPIVTRPIVKHMAKSVLAAGLIASGTLFTATALTVPAMPAFAACDPGTKIDKSTVNVARTVIQRAGYSKVQDLKKGCDNYWHGIAKKNGVETHVLMTPDGQVMTEGD